MGGRSCGRSAGHRSRGGTAVRPELPRGSRDIAPGAARPSFRRLADVADVADLADAAHLAHLPDLADVAHLTDLADLG